MARQRSAGRADELTDDAGQPRAKERCPQGDGSITQRSDGRWHARVDLGIVNGKRVRKSLYGKTQKEVAAKLREALGRKNQGALVTGARQTFGRFLDRWLRDIITPKCRPKTISSYRGLLDRHIKPALGHIALSKLSARDIQEFYAAKRDQKLSARTVVYMHALIRASLTGGLLNAADWVSGWRQVAAGPLETAIVGAPGRLPDTWPWSTGRDQQTTGKHAERSGEIGYSPVNRVAAPTSTRPDIKPLTVEEATRFLAVSADDRLAALWSLALHTGLRQGELLGLRWQDVDMERVTLTVLQTVQVIDGKIETGAPKSKGSRRTVPIEALAFEALKAWRTRQIEDRLKAGPHWIDSGLVFTSHVGTPLFARNVSRRWHQLLDAAGIERRGMHATRHTTATLLMAAGEHPKVVQELLGHATIALTLDTYSHVSEGQREQATAKLGALLTPTLGVNEASGGR